MQTFISLLRGINVSGSKMIRKDELINLYRQIGVSDITTYLQSGNVLFASTETDPSVLAAMIESQIEKTFGYSVSVFVHDLDYFSALIEGNPFTNQISEEIKVLHATFLYASPDSAKLDKLEKPKDSNDSFAIGDQVIYLYCPDGYGRTKLSNTYFERKLGLPATTRNWNTVLALYQMGLEQKRD